MYHLVIDRITKSFGEFKALDDVSLHVHKNSIHVILGENGAGKTTLMNVLFGLYLPDEGRIEIDGHEVLIDNPRKAIEYSIGMIHQHFMLVKSLTVTENIILGLKGQKASLHLREHEQRVREHSLHLPLDVFIQSIYGFTEPTLVSPVIVWGFAWADPAAEVPVLASLAVQLNKGLIPSTDDVLLRSHGAQTAPSRRAPSDDVR